MRQDILLDSNNDLQLYNGDFVIDNSDQQHVEHIVHAQKGEYRLAVSSLEDLVINDKNYGKVKFIVKIIIE